MSLLARLAFAVFNGPWLRFGHMKLDSLNYVHSSARWTNETRDRPFTTADARF